MFDELIKRLGRDFVSVLEVGSYEGRSALAWSAAIAMHCSSGGRVTCLDRWTPYHLEADILSSSTCRAMDELLRSGVVFENFKENIQLASPRAPIDHLVGGLSSFTWDSVFDVVYIDASHDFTDVWLDIEIAKDLVSPGGMLCGDDLELQLADANPEHTYQHRHEDYVGGYHPGVTLAVGTAFPSARAWCRECVWAMRKLPDGSWSNVI